MGAGEGRRDCQLHVRLSAAQREKIRRTARACGLNTTEFVLSRCLDLSEREYPPREALERVWRELRAQGRNLNQLAAAANRLARTDSARASDEVERALSALTDDYLSCLESTSEMLGRWSA